MRALVILLSTCFVLAGCADAPEAAAGTEDNVASSGSDGLEVEPLPIRFDHGNRPLAVTWINDTVAHGVCITDGVCKEEQAYPLDVPADIPTWLDVTVTYQRDDTEMFEPRPYEWIRLEAGQMVSYDSQSTESGERIKAQLVARGPVELVFSGPSWMSDPAGIPFTARVEVKTDERTVPAGTPVTFRMGTNDTLDAYTLEGDPSVRIWDEDGAFLGMMEDRFTWSGPPSDLIFMPAGNETVFEKDGEAVRLRTVLIRVETYDPSPAPAEGAETYTYDLPAPPARIGVWYEYSSEGSATMDLRLTVADPGGSPVIDWYRCQDGFCSGFGRSTYWPPFQGLDPGIYSLTISSSSSVNIEAGLTAMFFEAP